MSKNTGPNPRVLGGHPLSNGFGHYDATANKYEWFHAGPRKLTQEGVFIPRSASAGEGDGYFMGLVNNYETMSSELVILDTRDFSKPIAIVKLPIRLRQGLHGNWVDASDADGHPPKLS